jgi:hypothetical protein
MSRPILFRQGIEPPLSEIPVVIFGICTLWLAPKAARTWYKKPEAKRRRFKLPELSIDRGLGFLPLPGLSTSRLPEPGAPDGDAREESRPKLQRVRGGRLDFRVLAAMLGCGALGLVVGYCWLAYIIELNLGFALLVMCAAGLFVLSRRIYRDTFLVEETEGDEENEGLEFRLPEGMGGNAPMPAPLPRPAGPRDAGLRDPGPARSRFGRRAS